MNGIYDEARLALHAIWTRRWIALAAAWCVAVLGWLFVSQIHNTYESHARVFVQMQTILPAKVGITAADQQKAVDTVRQTVARYKGKVPIWHLIHRPGSTDILGMSEEDQIRLTARLLQVGRQIDL